MSTALTSAAVTVKHTGPRQTIALPAGHRLDRRPGRRGHDRWCCSSAGRRVTLAVYRQISLAGFARITLIAALIGGGSSHS
jgi:hypothetical protein